MINVDFNSILELLKAFPDEQTCIDHLEQLRWNGNVVSPFDPTSKVYDCKGNKYKCKTTGKYFNVRTGTLFDNTKVELQKWFLAIYIATSHKKGISSLQLSRDIDVTQKTAWFMLQRIRNCFGLASEDKLGENGEIVETDETIVGGKMHNKSRSVRKQLKDGLIDPMGNKTIVMGMIQRGDSLYMEVLKSKTHIIPSVLANINPNASLITDSSGVYKGIDKKYRNHQVIDHSNDEYVRGIVHTNTIEGVFSLFDRMIIGIYHFVSPKHLQKYCDEFTYRYNTRKLMESQRFNLVLANTEHRLTYKQLTNG